MIKNKEIRLKSYQAIKEFTGQEDSFHEKVNVIVLKNNISYLYKNIEIGIRYEYGYTQFRVDIMWEEDDKQINFKDLKLRGTYNTNFNEFFIENDNLILTDEIGIKITIIKKNK